MSEQLSSTVYNIIYVAAPAGAPSGGPELAQQLVHCLRLLGANAQIYYYHREIGVDPVYDEFKAYANPYADSIIDSSENLLIVPETKTNLLSDYSAIKKSIWWMSIDFYYSVLGCSIADHHALANPLQRFVKLLGKSKKVRRHFFFGRDGDADILHLVQSQYAREHLLSKNIAEKQIRYLSDYLNADFIRDSAAAVHRDKRDIVVYNPKKGLFFTRELMSLMPDVEFVAIENMSRNDVVVLLQSAKLYIDFGEHPGKDRIPREACISGACIITGKNGSAKFAEDVPIPAEFKFERVPAELPRIAEKIRQCLNDYEVLSQSFEAYRAMIRGEQAQFREDVRRLAECG